MSCAGNVRRRYILHTCPHLNVTRVQSATEWTASVHTCSECFLHLHTWLMLRNIMFLALAHMVVGWGGVGWGGGDNVPCTCTHGRCYATSCFLHLRAWSVLRNIMFLALTRMVDATQHHVSCTYAHVSLIQMLIQIY